MIEIIIYIILFLFALIITSLLFMPFIFGAPFQPSSRRRLQKMIELSGVKKGERVVDLGSGSGTVVIEFARRGAIADGYEINPLLVWYSRWRIKKLGLQKNAKIYRKNFFDVDLKKYNVVALFQVFFVMPMIAKKLKRELKKGSRIVSNTWKFPDWKPIKKDNSVYLYKV